MSEPAAQVATAERAMDPSQAAAKVIRAADESLAGVLELLREDPAYADALGITGHGVGYLAGVHAVLRSSAINHDL